MKGMPYLNHHALVILLFIDRMSEKTFCGKGSFCLTVFKDPVHHCVEIMAACLVMASYIMLPGNGDSDLKYSCAIITRFPSL